MELDQITLSAPIFRAGSRIIHIIQWRCVSAAVSPADYEDALRSWLLQQQPTPVAVVQWVVTGCWPDPGVRVDVAFAPPGTAPLI